MQLVGKDEKEVRRRSIEEDEQRSEEEAGKFEVWEEEKKDECRVGITTTGRRNQLCNTVITAIKRRGKWLICLCPAFLVKLFSPIYSPDFLLNLFVDSVPSARFGAQPSMAITQSLFPLTCVIKKKNPPLILGAFHVHELQEEKHKGKGRKPSNSNYLCFRSFDGPKTSNYLCFCSARRAAKSFIVGYCNGLFCIRSRSGFEIANLSTREVLLLPPPPPLPRPLRSNYITRYGFGFDPVKNHFKIVQLVDGRRCLVFTLGTESNSSSWRDIPVPEEVSSILNLYTHPYPEISPSGRNTALYAVRSLHWLLILPSFSIVSFNIHAEEFLLIPAPFKFSKFNFVRRYFFFEIKGLPSCGYQVGNGIHLSLLLNDPFSNPNPNPNWEEQTLHLPFPDCLPFSPFRLTCFLDHLVYYFYDHSRLAMFYRKDLKDVNYMISPPDTCFDRNLEPLFINHVENLLSLKRLVPPGAASDQVREIIQGRWT